jgi:hypothetical protein
MANIFGNTQTLKGAFKADLAKALINGTPTGLLIQNMQFSFSQNVAMLHEVGSSDVYYVVGRAQGTAGISRVIGPVALSIAFLQKLGDGCQAPTNQLQLNMQGGACVAGGTAGSAAGSYTLFGVLLTTISNQVAATDMLINEQLQLMFVNLDMSAG